MTDTPHIEEYGHFSQGIAIDGPVILKDGQPITPDDIVAELNRLTDALVFYADPESYFAIAFIPDHPCGEFIKDFDHTQALGDKPGMIARKVLGLDL